MQVYDTLNACDCLPSKFYLKIYTKLVYGEVYHYFLRHFPLYLQFDPNGRQCLTMDGYRAIGRAVRALANEHCSGQLLIVQEGGYHITYAAYCLHASLEGALNLQKPLLSDPLAYYPEDEDFTEKVVNRMKTYFTTNVPFLKEITKDHL